jgi:hypothetical protein
MEANKTEATIISTIIERKIRIRVIASIIWSLLAFLSD